MVRDYSFRLLGLRGDYRTRTLEQVSMRPDMP